MCKGDVPLRSSPDWMWVWCPQIAPMKGKNKLGDQIYERWSYGMRILEDFYRNAEEAFHKFHCPLYVVVGSPAFELEKRFKSGRMSEKETAWYLPFSSIRGISSRDSYYKWERWTTGTCEFIEVDADHASIWYHIETETKLWQAFLKLS